MINLDSAGGSWGDPQRHALPAPRIQIPAGLSAMGIPWDQVLRLSGQGAYLQNPKPTLVSALQAYAAPQPTAVPQVGPSSQDPNTLGQTLASYLQRLQQRPA